MNVQSAQFLAETCVLMPGSEVSKRGVELRTEPLGNACMTNSAVLMDIEGFF